MIPGFITNVRKPSGLQGKSRQQLPKKVISIALNGLILLSSNLPTLVSEVYKPGNISEDSMATKENEKLLAHNKETAHVSLSPWSKHLPSVQIPNIFP